MAVGVSAQAPDPQAKDENQNGDRHKPVKIGQGKPAFSNGMPAQRRPDADHGDDRQQRQQRTAGQLAHTLLQRAFAFHNQPGRAKQRISHHQP